MYKLFSIIFVAYCLGACNAADDTVAGGACTYTYDTIPARILSIDSITSDRRNLMLVLEKKGVYKTDTIDYYAEFNHHVEPAVLKEKNITVNDTLTFVAANMISGSCNPNAGSTLLIEHYKK